MSFKKILLVIGLLGVAFIGLCFVSLFGVYQNEMNKLAKNPIKYYREGLHREVQHLNHDLHAAAYRGEREQVLRLIENGQDIHAKSTSFRFTPFHMAIFNGHTEIAELLLSKGAKINEKSNYNQTPLHWAAMMGQEESVKFLLERGVPPNDASEQGWTALHCASRMGHINIVKMLMEYGARKDQKTPEGQTAKGLAETFNKREVASYLDSI